MRLSNAQEVKILSTREHIAHISTAMLLNSTAMLLNAGEEERTRGSRVALLFGVPGMLVGSILITWILLRYSDTQAVSVGALPGTPTAIAPLLFHDFLLPFEVTSVLILIAIMGAVVLASRETLPPAGERRQR